MSAKLRASPNPPRARASRAIERIEAQSAYSQHLCAPPELVRRLGMEAGRIGSASVILTRKSTNLYYNRVIALGQTSPATEAQLDRAIAEARDCRVAALAVNVGPSARPAEMTRWLHARGFQPAHPSGKLWRDGAPLPRSSRAPGIRVRRVRHGQAALWVDVVSKVWRTFGSRRAWFEARVRTPGWRHYLAWIDGQPVAAGALFIGTVAGATVGHLVDGVTLGPWRRRGAQAAIIRRRVSDGLASGCTLFTSETAPPLPRMPLVSFRNLCRQGFEFAYLRGNWKLDLTLNGDSP